MKTSLGSIALVLLLLVAPTPAFAHGGGDHVHGLVAGLQHPLFGLDHLLAMLAVGIIAARTGGRDLFVVPISFVLSMIGGAVAGMGGIGLPSLESGIALSLVVFGATMALARPLPPTFAVALTGLFGLFHGNAHGLEVPETVAGIAYGVGFVLATSILHAAGVALVLKRLVAVRTAGIIISTVGIWLAAQAV